MASTIERNSPSYVLA